MKISTMTAIINENVKHRVSIDVELDGVRYFGDVQVEILGSYGLSADCNFTNGMQSVSMDGTVNNYNMIGWKIEADHPFKDRAPYLGSLIEGQLLNLGIIPVYDYYLRLDWLLERSGNFIRENIGVYSQAAPINFIGLCNVERNVENQYVGHFKLRFPITKSHHFYYHYDGPVDNTIIHGFIITQEPYQNHQGFNVLNMIMK